MYSLFLVPLTFSSVVSVPPLEGTSPPDDRIIGGKDANIADYPYTLCLISKTEGPICGATLIDEEWALTAAHCVFGEEAEKFTIRAGSSLSASGGQLVDVANIHQYEYYDDETLENDIALLKLAAKVTVKNSKVIPLPTNRPIADEIATATGWGGKHENDEMSPVLQVVQVLIVDQEDCRDAYSSDEIPDTMLCAGFLGKGGKDSCPGDSGGPLVVDGELAGVTSWGDGCGRRDKPGIYTDVSSFLGWIRKIKISYRCSSLHTPYKGTLI